MEPTINKITEDNRGAIFLVNNLLPENKEFTFMEMKKGSARGGCFHSKDEFFVIIKGKIKFICGNKEQELSTGDSGKIPASKPHAFIALEDSIVSEWGITTEEKVKDIKNKELRALVDKINNPVLNEDVSE